MILIDMYMRFEYVSNLLLCSIFRDHLIRPIIVLMIDCCTYELYFNYTLYRVS